MTTRQRPTRHNIQDVVANARKGDEESIQILVSSVERLGMVGSAHPYQLFVFKKTEGHPSVSGTYEVGMLPPRIQATLLRKLGRTPCFWEEPNMPVSTFRWTRVAGAVTCLERRRGGEFCR